jgi:hypothetical protein
VWSKQFIVLRGQSKYLFSFWGALYYWVPEREIKKSFLAIRALPVREADSLTAICEPIAQAMWDPQHFTIP